MAVATIAMALMLAAQAAPQPTRPMQAEVKAGVDAWQRGDFARAVESWRKPALAGDADAQFNLGQAYKLGRGVRVDLKQAEEWYRLAALQGHAQAQDNYGLILYQNGRKAEAMKLLEQSAGRGEPRAQYVYGTELFNGEIAPKDWVRAYAMMTRASAAGIPRASESLAQMDRFVAAPERQKGIALAREMELRTSRAQIAAADPGMPAAKPRPAQPAATPRPSPPAARPPRGADVAAAKPAPRPAAQPAATPPASSAASSAASSPPAGRWRVQLGAFGDAGRANALWRQLSGRVGALSGMQSYPVKAGSVTRLQAGPFANEAAADRACASIRAAGNPCLVVRP